MPSRRRSVRLAFGLLFWSTFGAVVCRAQDVRVGSGSSDPPRPGAQPRSKPVRKDLRRATKDSVKPEAAAAKPVPNAPDSAKLKFSRDVAPILVGNCVNCHTMDGNGLRRSGLDLSSFNTLMAGSPSHKVVVSGKPDESSLYLRVHGDETPAMPPGDRTLSDAAIAKIERWIREGAVLDPGLDPKAAFGSYAPTPEELRRLELAQLSAEERDRKVEDVGRARLAQANPKLKPEITRGEHFLLFGNLPGERASRSLKAVEAQLGALKRIVGSAAMEWPEKVSLYVFNERKDLIEFIRTVEGRDVDIDVRATARMLVAQPYCAILDPAHGGEEPITAHKRRTGRSKKVGESPPASAGDRTLAGLMTDTFVTGTVRAAGKAPGWLSSGLGGFFAERVEPRSSQIHNLRSIAANACRTGWNAKATEILGDNPEMNPEEMRAIGYAMVTWLMSPELSRAFPRFVAGLLKNPSDLNGVLKSVYNTSFEEFLTSSGEWVAVRFGTAE